MRVLHPLGQQAVTNETADLTFLAPYVAGKLIVGLGEVTHGTHEVFTLKTRLVQYLVLSQQTRVVAIEMSYGATFALGDYVAGRRSGRAVELLDEIGIQTYQTRELVTLVEWLRAHNEALAPSDRVELVGFDLQDPRSDVRVVLDYLRETLPTAMGGVDPAMVAFAAERGSIHSIAPVRVSALRSQLASLTSLVEGRADVLRARSSSARYERYRYALEVARTAFALFDEPNEAAAVFRRDREDSAHVLWLRARSHGGPLALWAHNAHVARDNIEYDAYAPIGEMIARELGDRYYAIGTAFFAGSVYAKTGGRMAAINLAEPRPGSLEHFLLAAGGGASFFVDLDAAMSRPDWARVLTLRSTMRAIGSTYVPDDNEATYRPTVLRRMFDAVIFLPTSTAAEPNAAPAP